MNITPVKINISDLRKFAYVAFLVDRDDFLQDMINLRKKWRLDKHLLSFQPTKRWFTFPWRVSKSQMEKYEKATEKLENTSFNLNITGKMSVKDKNKFLNSLEKSERLLPSNDFQFSVTTLRKKYHRPPNFDRIIAHTVLYGKVADQDYVTCEAKIIYPELEFPQYFQDPKLVIDLNPPVKIDDIVDKIKNDLPNKILEYEKNFIEGKIKEYDTMPSIKRNRSWYWFKKDHSWSEVLEKAKKDIGGNIALSSVRSGVSDYEKRLITRI